MNGKERVIIEHIRPQVNGGDFPAKRIINELVQVEADIFCDSHDLLSAEILYKHEQGRKWMISEMTPEVNDRWEGSFKVEKMGTYHFTVQAWVDKFKSWHRDMLT